MKKKITMTRLNREYRKKFSTKIGKGKDAIVSYPAYSREILMWVWELLEEQKKDQTNN